MTLLQVSCGLAPLHPIKNPGYAYEPDVDNIGDTTLVLSKFHGNAANKAERQRLFKLIYK